MFLFLTHCVYSDRDTPRLSDPELQKHLQALPAWQLNDSKTSLARSFTAKNFVAGTGENSMLSECCYPTSRHCLYQVLHAAAVKFFDQVAEIAEEEGHHPDLHLTNYREVQVPKHTIGKVQCSA